MINKIRKFILLNSLILSFSFGIHAQPVTFLIDIKKKAQRIDNIGASGAWFSEGIGKYWPVAKKERMAELLFSKSFNTAGNPLGIGLSAWRFNIGGGTAEQGDSSGISNPIKRVECFLSPNGSYNWNKQEGYMWFVKKAASYKVEDLIAFSNTPPVQFTKNGLGFKLVKDDETNLKEDKYGDYAGFLASVIKHFDDEGLHFNYISPVNEPQWDWSNKFGQMNQEGSPWHTKDIHKITLNLDSALFSQNLSTKILIPEAGTLTALYEGNGHASKQIQQFYAPNSNNYVGNLAHLKRAIEGHSYFTDFGDTTIVSVRKNVRKTAEAYKIPFWQSEYSLLGDGYKEGQQGRRSAMDCALFLAKIIYHDLAIANASAWHFWNAWEPSRADVDTRYCLLALKNNAANTEGDFTITKNLWAFGHYSRFIRPGMRRVIIERNDGLNDIQIAKDVMLSAFTDGKKLIVVAVNYTLLAKEINLDVKNRKIKKWLKQYITTAAIGDDLKPSVLNSLQHIVLHPRSIATIVVNIN